MVEKFFKVQIISLPDPGLLPTNRQVIEHMLNFNHLRKWIQLKLMQKNFTTDELGAMFDLFIS